MPRAVFAAILFLGVCVGGDELSDEASDDEDVVGHVGGTKKDAVHEYTIEHCLTPPCNPMTLGSASGFVERGLIKYKKSKRHDDYVTIPQNSLLSPETERAIQELDLYTVRLVCRTTSACEASAIPVFSSVNACRFTTSEYKDTFVLHLGHDGNLVSFDYNADGEVGCASLPRTKTGIPESHASSNTKIRTSALITRPKEMQVLELPMIDEGPVNQRGEPVKPTNEEVGGVFGYLRKYWYIIVPMMVLNVMSSGVEPPKEGGAGGAAKKK